MQAARRLIAVVAALAACAASPAVTARSGGAVPSTIAVVVIDTGPTGPGVRTALVDVGSGMSGLDALSEVAAVTTYGFAVAGKGAAVCSIDHFGNEASQSGCLIGPNGEYWAYFHSAGGSGAWSYSPVGAGNYTVHGGDVEGWRYGTGQKPTASPVFCDYVSCPPPATSSPPGAAPARAAEASGAPGAAARASGAEAGRATVDGSAASPSPTADGAAPPDATTPTSTPPTSELGSSRDLAASRSFGKASVTRADGGSGSPTGVIVAGILVAVAFAAAFWLRRRTRSSG